VASAFAGLEAQEVTVVDLKGNQYTAGSGPAGSVADYLGQLHAMHAFYHRAVMDALAYVPGAVATVNVELDSRIRDATESIRNVPESTPWLVRETESRVTNSNTLLRPFDEPRESPGELFPLTGPATAAEENRGREEQKIVSQERSYVEQAGLTPRKVTVAVAVPSSYYERVWLEQHPNMHGRPTGPELELVEREENAKIRRAVAQVIPGCDRPQLVQERIAVNCFPVFAAAAGPPAHAATGWTLPVERVLPLLASGATVLVLLVLMRAAGWTWPLAQLFARRGAGSEAPAAVEEPSPAVHSGSAARELSEAIEAHPAAAARALRDWIAKAS
jgi:hypothetical protein